MRVLLLRGLSATLRLKANALLATVLYFRLPCPVGQSPQPSSPASLAQASIGRGPKFFGRMNESFHSQILNRTMESPCRCCCGRQKSLPNGFIECLPRLSTRVRQPLLIPPSYCELLAIRRGSTSYCWASVPTVMSPRFSRMTARHTRQSR